MAGAGLDSFLRLIQSCQINGMLLQAFLIVQLWIVEVRSAKFSLKRHVGKTLHPLKASKDFVPVDS